MSMNHRFHKSRRCTLWMSQAQKHCHHKHFKQLTMSTKRPPLKQQILRVLVDMDGVICDFEQSFLDKFRKQHPDEPYIPLNERKGFYIDDQYAKIKPSLQVSFTKP